MESPGLTFTLAFSTCKLVANYLISIFPHTVSFLIPIVAISQQRRGYFSWFWGDKMRYVLIYEFIDND